jgi:very-short-patch-repair endonuclease
VPSELISASVVNRCAARQLPALLRELPSHCIQIFVGVTASLLRDLLYAASDSPHPETARPVLFLDLQEGLGAETIVANIIDQLAGVAGGLWPLWFGGEDFSQLNDSALAHQYLPIRLSALTPRCPQPSVGWAEAAIRRLLRGQRPRVPDAAADIEWSQLCHAVDPKGLITVVTLPRASLRDALGVVHALEWLAANGNVAIVILCDELPSREPPFDRLLYGARAIVPDVFLPTHVDGAQAGDASLVALVLPAVHGRPHPQSPIEQRLSRMIEADDELRSKFVFNACVEDVSLKSPRVDLLWAEGRLVIELDGEEHRARRAYRDDRHRDYELLRGGYVVVRIPNDEIVEDFERTVEKIRSAVRWRRSSSGAGNEQ